MKNMKKINYHAYLEEIIRNLDKSRPAPNLLLHACCAPCASYVIEFLAPHFKITIYFYNPNIEPYWELKKREKEIVRFCDIFLKDEKIDVILPEYENKIFHQVADARKDEREGGLRCYDCYALRLDKTAKYAQANNFDFFGTTLSISPHKNAFFINSIGEKLAKIYNVNYLYGDFKKNNGYKRSIELSKQYNLYRQNYCGCVFSMQKEVSFA